MKLKIISHSTIREPGGYDTFRFGYTIEGGDVAPRSDYVSVRTARVLVRELGDGNPFMKMLFAIANAGVSDYEELVGRVFMD
jgi:hypothetical protein